MAHFVVVGGGIAGLTAANDLADTGAHVTVLEQSRSLGGRARTTQEGHYFLNLGPHALYRGGIAARTFTNWKIPFSGGDPGATARGLRPILVRGDQVYPAVRDLRTLLTSRIFNLREKVEVARLLSLFSAANAGPGESTADWLHRSIRSTRVRNYAEMVVRGATYSTDFEHLSARAAMRQISMALKQGVLYLDKGWHTIVNGLAHRACSLGVEIHCGEPVARLDSIRGDGIVLAVDPETVELLTGVSLPARRTARVACLDLCLSRFPKGAATVAFALDRPLYFSVHSAVAHLAPAGGATVQVMKYLDESESNPQELRSELEGFADLAMPKWRQCLERARFLPRLTVTEAIPSVRGRADVAPPGMDGVTIAGDWVGSEGMLADAAVASALEAAKTIQQPKEVLA
jgi:phytoene dehydrogenase-like protein